MHLHQDIYYICNFILWLLIGQFHDIVVKGGGGGVGWGGGGGGGGLIARVEEGYGI